MMEGEALEICVGTDCLEYLWMDDTVSYRFFTHLEEIGDRMDMFPPHTHDTLSEGLERLDISLFIGDDDIFGTFFSLEKTLHDEESSSGTRRMGVGC